MIYDSHINIVPFSLAGSDKKQKLKFVIANQEQSNFFLIYIKGPMTCHQVWVWLALQAVWKPAPYDITSGRVMGPLKKYIFNTETTALAGSPLAPHRPPPGVGAHQLSGLASFSPSWFRSRTTPRGPPFPTSPRAQAWAPEDGGSLRACWRNSGGQEESRTAWRRRKSAQRSALRPMLPPGGGNREGRAIQRICHDFSVKHSLN